MSTMIDLAFPVLDAFLKRHGSHHGERCPVAVFDCDGTVIKGDVGEAMLYHQIEEFQFKVSPALLWPDAPRGDELDSLYRILADRHPRARGQSPEFSRFANLILSWYFDQIRDGDVAKACADIVRLFAGYSLQEVRSLAYAACHREFSSPITERSLGGHIVPRGIRYIYEAVNLIRSLQSNCFDIWIVSGSSRWSVEPVFTALGISTERVIGIDLFEKDGVFTPEEKRPVPVKEGKVAALRECLRSAPLLVASDSTYDIPLFLHATELKVRIASGEQSTDEFFTAAGIGPDDSWIVIENPTVLEPGEL